MSKRSRDESKSPQRPTRIQSIHQSTDVHTIDQSNDQSISESNNQSVNQAIHPSINRSNSQMINQSNDQADQSDSQSNSQSDRQLTSHTNSQLVNQSNSQSISQSNNPSLDRSKLERLPSAVFVYVCSFLTVQDKLTTLPIINQSINQSLFNVQTCCNTNEMDLNYRQFVDNRSISQSIAILGRKLTVAPYVRQVTIDLSRWFYIEQMNQSINQSVNQSISQLSVQTIYQKLLYNNLQSLIVKEAVYDRTPYEPQSHFVMLMDVLASINQPTNQSVNQSNSQSINQSINQSIKLRRFQILLERPTAAYRYPLINWRGVRQLTDLTHFEFEDGTGVPNSPVLTGLINHLPDSLVDLRILSPICMQDDWRSALSRNDVLPVLSVFSPGGTAPQSFGNELTVIMKSTNQTRPFTLLEIEINQSVELDKLLNLTSIQLSMDADTFDRFVSLSSTALPVLTSCWLTILADDPGDDDPSDQPIVDLNPLFMMLSQRQLTELMFQAKHCFCVPLTDQSVVAMSKMKELQTLVLTLNNQPCFVNEEIGEFLPARCWPNLTRFEMDSFLCSINQMETFLAAIPALIEFQWYDSMIESTFVISQLIDCCPFVERIVCCSDIPPTELREVKATLTHVSFANTVIQSIFIDELDDAALHYVLSKMSEAPNLTEFKLVPKLPDSVFRACCYRALPKLRMYAVGDSELFDDDREGVSNGFFHSDLVMFYMKDENDQLVFNTTLDAQGRDGRQALFEALYDVLYVHEKELIDAFDRGDYSGWPDSEDEMPELDEEESDEINQSDQSINQSTSHLINPSIYKSLQ